MVDRGQTKVVRASPTSIAEEGTVMVVQGSAMEVGSTSTAGPGRIMVAPIQNHRGS